MVRRIAMFAAASCLSFVAIAAVAAHEGSLHRFLQRQRHDHAVLLAQAGRDNDRRAETGSCRLTISLTEAGHIVAGNIKLTRQQNGEALALNDLIQRPNGWFSCRGKVTVHVPQERLLLHAFQGLETELTACSLDLRGVAKRQVKLKLQRFYRASDQQLVDGNTHLHLNRISRKEADRYLQVVPAADDVELLYVSHLRRVIDDATYVTNEYDAQSLAQLSSAKTTLRYGEEHRHNFDKFGEGYGHVMFLDIPKLIEPVSLGPGLTGAGTDGVPLRRGIDRAKADGGSVIWCHNTFGFEDLPLFVSKQLRMLNIFDGGDHGSYEDSYYRYLNIGLPVAFSTGTDWFMYDLSRVYVPLAGETSSQRWLQELSQGKSYITNGTFLEFTANRKAIGDTIQLTEAASITIQGKALGRSDFKSVEIIYNGKVIKSIPSSALEAHFEATVYAELNVTEPGWLALRVAKESGKNEFGQLLFAHTSPIYIELGGKRIFKRDTAQELAVEMERSLSLIKMKGRFADEQERENVFQVYRSGLSTLRSLGR